MDITYLGHSSFKLKGKTASVVTDPFDPEMVGIKYPKQEADIVTVSHQHRDHNKTDLVSGARRVITGAGEYEIMGVSIIGIQSYHDNKKGEERGKNTIYVIEMDSLRLCHLGDLGHDLSESTIDAIGRIDVLMVPVGGGFTIGPSEAVSVVQKIEASVTIPMHFQAEGLKSETFAELLPVESFLKEIGATVETLPKLSLTKADLLEGEQKVYVLEKK